MPEHLVFKTHFPLPGEILPHLDKPGKRMRNGEARKRGARPLERHWYRSLENPH
jgi:hypothetical protein